MDELKKYSDYKSTVSNIVSCLKKVSEFNEDLALKNSNEAINAALKRLEDDTFNIAIVGEFNRGKSSVINALLGKKNVLPVSIMPCTATVNKIIYELVPSAKVLYKDGTSEQLDLTTGSDILKQYLTKLTEESRAKAELIKEVLIYYPVDYCRNGVTIIDTPGLNDDEAMTEVTLSVLPSTDVAIMVLMAKAPYSKSEKELLESKIITSDLGKVIFVVNGIDQVESEEDKQRIIAAIKDRISEASLKKVKSVYGEDSTEFTDYKNKLGNIKVFGLSARNAVKAKEEKNTELLQESRFPEFEKELERFIVEERGVISLLNPINKLKTASIEILRTCALRESALDMELNDFIEKYNKAEFEINELRKKQECELLKISKAADLTYLNLTPEINSFWGAVLNVLNNFIDNYPISNENLKKENIKETQKRLFSEVQEVLESTAQSKSEYIKECIIKDLKAETDRLSDFEKEFFEEIEKIQNCMIPPEKLPSYTGESSDLTATVMNYFASAGGFYQGFKRAGWKGALIGGAAGIAGTSAGVWGVSSLLVALSIPISAPVLVVGGVIAALAGTFAGKWILDILFPSDKVEKFKTEVKKKINEELGKIQSKNDFSVKVKDLVDSMFNALKEKVRTETNTMLDNTQSQLSNLKVELTENKINKTAEIERIKLIVEEVTGICSNIKTIDDQLQQIIKAKQNQGV